MCAKVHIDLSRGIFEADGEPEFVKDMYLDFKTDLLSKLANNNAVLEKPQLKNLDTAKLISLGAVAPAEITLHEAKPKKAKSAGKKNSYSVLDLDTGLPNEENSIFVCLEKYKPTSNIQRNVVFLKFLKTRFPTIAVTLEHVNTCYSNAGLKPVGDLYGSVTDTAKVSKGYGYIDTANLADIRLTQKGEVLLYELEHAPSKTQ